MKNTFLSIAITLLTIASAGAQVKLVQKDTLFRFRVEEVSEGEFENDTLIVRYFPDRFVSRADARQVIVNQLAIHQERIRELQRLIAADRAFLAEYAKHYDTMFGAGAFIAWQKDETAKSLTGDWVLIERGTTNRWELNISPQGQVTGQRTGTIAANNDLDIIASGLFTYNLTFTWQANGNLRASRTTATGTRTFVLKRAAV